jgi:hypothetical protein
MSDLFPIVEVPIDAAAGEEAMGTKYKFWFQHPELGNCLFKRARPNTGEDWSEKIAAELAQLLGLPHAEYQLATWNGLSGTISPAMMDESAALMHGNDVLANLSSGYPRSQGYNASQHTLDVVIRAISSPTLELPLKWTPPNGVITAVDTFVGYLLLDAWIGNGDRHHENWGFVQFKREKRSYLSPTYDHASCLGRELLDVKRQEHLLAQTVGQYAEKSRSAFFRQAGDRKTMMTFEAFSAIAQYQQQAANVWLNQLAQIPLSSVQLLFERIPKNRISLAAIEFGYRMLEINKNRLMTLQGDLA